MVFTFQNFIAKLVLAKAFPPLADLDSNGQKARFNEALEVIMDSGRWKGMQRVLNLTANSSGELTVPRGFRTIQGIKVDGFVRNMAGPWYSFLPGTGDDSQWSTNAVDQGVGFVTFAQPTTLINNVVTSTPAKLRVASTGGSGTVEVHGLDANGAEIWTGAQRGTLLTFNAAKAVPYFSTVTEIIKPITTQLCSLIACFDDNTEQTIGIYQPGETIPNYRKYLISDTASASPVPGVAALCLREHVDMVADNDIVPIGHFSAMKHAVLGVHWSDQGDEDRMNFHLNKAVDMLNDELRLQRPPTEIAGMRVSAIGCGATGLKAMR